MEKLDLIHGTNKKPSEYSMAKIRKCQAEIESKSIWVYSDLSKSDVMVRPGQNEKKVLARHEKAYRERFLSKAFALCR